MSKSAAAAEVPAGFHRNHLGHLVPDEQIKAIDLARDELVREIVDKARAQSEALATFKRETFGDIAAFVDLSAEKYGVHLGGQKGNVSLTSYDGRYKVIRAIAENVVFDERLKSAKALIDECLKEWSEGSPAELQTIVQDAFRVDQEGNIRVQQVLGLRRLAIDDPRWLRAMEAISDAIQIVGSKSYVRVYERVADTTSYRQIPLDVSGVPA
jgi:hypothetical protein